MKTKKYIILVLILVFVRLLPSCLKDLDTLPVDGNSLISEEVYSTADGYRGVLAKCYASLVLTGQGGSGGRDVPNIDEGYSGYVRALYYLQVATTDEMAFHAGGGHGTFALLYQNWDPSTQVISYPYYRLYMAIGYANEFLRESTEARLRDRGLYDELKDEMPFFRAEARLIRAYCYQVVCDLYGSGPFVDETMPIGTIPKQKSRKEIFDYVAGEGEEISAMLKAPGTNEYGRVDQVAAWFLLARHYLNAEVWAGKNEYEKAYFYAKKIIDDGSYPLAPDYRHIFLADNNTCTEIIWPLINDADNAQGSAGTNFFVKAFMSGSMNNHFLTGVGTAGWGNGRAKTQLVDLFEEADQLFYPDDPWGDNKMDKRSQFFTTGHTKETWVEGREFLRVFTNGYAIIKWRNMTRQRLETVPGGIAYTSIDFPLFRTGDAYLMAAEAILRGASGTRQEALGYVNEIRDRAYMSGAFGPDASGRITDDELTLDFIIDERGREMHTEVIRRTDLIRFGRFTKGYNWDWKGSDGSPGNHIGRDIHDRYRLFPIPQDEFTVNPYLTQNPEF